MKKTLSVLCAAAILCGMSLPAFAADSDKEARQAFRESIAAQKQQIKDNRAGLKALSESNKELRAAIKEIIRASKSGETPNLTEEQLQQVQALRQEIKDVRTSYEDTKGMIKEILTANKENIKDMDYDATIAALEEAANIQDTRLGKKTDVQNLLDEISDILN